jgi:hypothetical protein
MALKTLLQITHRQGVAMASSDVFLLLTFLFAGLALAAIWCAGRPHTCVRSRTLRQRHFVRAISRSAPRIKFGD